MQLAQITQAVHAIDAETDEQPCNDDGGKRPLQQLVTLGNGFASQLCILQIVGRAYHLLTHDDVVHRVLDAHVTFLSLKGLLGIAGYLVDFRLEFICISCIGQLEGLSDGVVIALVGNGFAYHRIIIIGGAEIIPQRFFQLYILSKGFVHLFPVAHRVGYNHLETNGITIFIAGTIGLDNLDGTVEVLHGLLWLGIHLDVRQVHIERHQIGGL